MSEHTPEEVTEEVPVDSPEDLPNDIPGEEMVEGQGEQLMNFLSSGGIKQALLAENYYDEETDNSYSQAHIIADVINVMRMDAKQMAALHDIDVRAEKMTPERAAALIEEMATGEDITALIKVFQDIEENMDLVFQQKMEQDTYQEYDQFKEQMLYTGGGDE